MKNEWVKGLLVLVIIGCMLLFVTTDFFLTFAAENKLLSGFIKFFMLASMGDVVGLKFRSKEWRIPKGFIFKAIVWGLIGVVIVLMFSIFSNGVITLQDEQILPFAGNTFFFAFFTSVLMNVIFAPTMMLFHRLTDTYIELYGQHKFPTFRKVVEHINIYQFFTFTIFKTIPLFWIPAHTITFLLPVEYRVIFAAMLGIILGILLGIKPQKKAI